MIKKFEITRQLVPVERRIAVADKMFGLGFSRKLEPAVFAFASHLSDDYTGGLWNFYTLSNGGFYMAPDAEKRFTVSSENGFAGVLSADGFGITVCLYGYSHLSFGEDALAETCADHFHWLREFALGHDEVGGILRAVD